MYIHRRIYRIVAQRTRQVVAWLKRKIGKLFSKPIAAISVLAGIGIGVAIAVAGILRVVDPVPLMVVGPFEMPESKDSAAFTGKTLSNLLVDDLQDIIQDGNHFQGLKDTSSRKQYGKLPNTPEIPIQTSFGLEIKGISLDQMQSLWNYLRYHQQLIGGDLVITKNGGAEVVLRLTSKGMARHWETPVSPPLDYSKVRDAVAYLAAELMSDMNPEITGRYFLGQHQYENAQEVLRQWVQREPVRPEPYYYLALSFEGAVPPRRQEAELVVRKACALDPKYHLAIGLLAALEAYRNDLKDAIADNIKAHQLAPKAPNYLNNLAVDYEQMGDEKDKSAAMADYDTAISYAKETLRTDPNMVAADYVLAMTLDSKGDAAGAIAAARDAIRRRPDYFQALQKLSDLLIANKKTKEAVDECTTSTAVNPDSWEPWQALGRALLSDGQTDKAITAFRTALDKNKTSNKKLLHADLAEALLQRATELLKQNQFKEATDYSIEALKENPAAKAAKSKFDEELQKLQKGKSPPNMHRRVRPVV